MTHGVIINGETFVNGEYPADKFACGECELSVTICAVTFKEGPPCTPLKVMRRVIFIQPTQPKKGQAK